jgi:molybdate transport system substrate-binding protein
MRRLIATSAAALLLAGACGGKRGDGKQIRVAAAADLQRAFAELGPAFQKKTGIEPVFIFGSTGLLTKQIENGAPFDALAAANVTYVDEVVKAGDCDGATQSLYARGRLVVWTPPSVAPPATLAELADPRFARIAIANPEHAPYGIAARMAMQKAGVWNAVESRMVYGENVQQALQFAQSGNADAAVIAQSLLTASDAGRTLSVDPSMHDPIDQAMVVCKNGGNADGAKQFVQFVASPAGREIMTRYGFLLPGEQGAPPHAAAEPPPIPEREVRGLVAQWLAAQNAGDAAAWSALYAARFTGIKRAGDRTWRLARAGWLAERGKHLDRKVRAAATDAAVRIAGPVAVVDLPPLHEELLVVRTPDGLRIGREEELPPAADPAARTWLSFVVEIAGARYAIVADRATAPGTGELTPVVGGGPVWTTEAVQLDRAPPDALAWKGKRVAVYGAAAPCQGTLGELVRVSGARPPAETRGEWDGDGGAPPLTQTGRARALTALAPPMLAARLEAPCRGDWVDLGGGPPGVAFTRDEPDAALAEAERAALRVLPEWRDAQADYAAHFAGKGDWIDADGGVIEAHVFASPDGKTRYLAAHAHAGTGCGDFEGDVTALWQIDARGALTRVAAHDAPFPRAITDVDGDGAVELLTDTDVYLVANGAVTPARHLDLHDYDGPC